MFLCVCVCVCVLLFAVVLLDCVVFVRFIFFFVLSVRPRKGGKPKQAPSLSETMERGGEE